MAADLNEQVFPPLNVLLQAPSKEIVLQLLHEAFVYRNSKVPAAVLAAAQEILKIEQEPASQLLQSLKTLVHHVVFESLNDIKEIYNIFPETFHKNLRELLTKIMADNVSKWRTAAGSDLVSLPQLLDFDWRVDIKTSSDVISRMSVPSCLLQLKIQENPAQVDQLPDVQCLNVELTKETLDTMLDGLGKIRDQLSSVARKS